MKFLFTLCFIFISGYLPAQKFAFELWHDGKLVLETGDTLKGQIKYDLPNNLIQYQSSSHFESYTSRKVVFFEIFDVSIKNYRQFYSLPYSSNNSYKSPFFFELISEGKVTALCREHIEYRTYNPTFYYYSTYTKLILVNQYYILKESGDVMDVPSRKNDWLEIMRDKEDEIARFAKTNHLDFDNKYQLKEIVTYYNSFFAPK